MPQLFWDSNPFTIRMNSDTSFSMCNYIKDVINKNSNLSHRKAWASNLL